MAVDKLVDSALLDAALGDIADVIRSKTGISGSFDFPNPNEIAEAIDFNLLMPTGTKSITENGTDIDVASYSKVDVNVSGGGSTVYKGEFTPTERRQTTTFYAPGCTYLAVGAKTKPDLTTGKGFVYSLFCSAGRYDCARSSNSGTSVAGDAFATTNAAVSYANDTFSLYWGTFNDTAKVFQPGITYVWCAW